MLVYPSRSTTPEIYLVFLVNLLHASLALRLRNDLSSVLDNDLMRLKSSHCTHTVATILGIQNLDAVVIAIALCTLLQLCKRSVVTLLLGQWTVGAVALVGHDAVMTGFSAPVLHIAIALRSILLVALP